MTNTLTAVIGDAGVYGVGRLITTQLKWYYRPQTVSDVGIDVLVEPVLGGRESGRLLALQVKAGDSWRKESTRDGNGWVFRARSQRHRDYWLSFKAPVLLVLYDVEADVAYWQHITPETAIVTGKGFKVEVPNHQRIDAAAHDVLARLAREVPPDGLTELLHQLPSSCATWLQRWDEVDPVKTRRVAAELVAGRDRPERTVRAVSDHWVGEQSWLAWMAVGEYAHEYELPAVAAELFLAADRAGGEAAPSARLRAFAGLMLSSAEPGRARTLLEECSALPETRLLAAVGLATLDHDADSGPVPVPAEVDMDADGAVREPTVQWFLAQQRQRVGDWDGAVLHYQQALVHAPGSTKLTLAVADALLRRASSGALSSTADYKEAALHADAARAEFRRWHGNSVQAAHVLMQARIMAADDTSAFRVALAQPDGEATPKEAASPLLAFTAARIAFGRGDAARGEQFAAVIEASGDAIWVSHLSAVRADASGADLADRVAAWRAVLDVDDETSRRVVVCAHLAAMGCWPVPELDEMHAAGLLTPGTYETQHARALAAAGDPDQALTVLRGLRRHSLIAAEAYVQLLSQQGKIDECLQACQDASVGLGAGHLEILALDTLARADRIEQLIAYGTDLLSRTDLPYRLRHHIRARLIDGHERQHAWNVCEQLAQRGLQEVTQHEADLRAGRHDVLMMSPSAVADLAELRRQYAWMIIIQQLNQGHTDRAFTTLSTLAPDVQSPIEVATWLELHQLRGWTLAAAEVGLDLARRADQPDDLVGRILATLIHAVPAADDLAYVDFHERLDRAWQEYLEQQPQNPLATTPSEQIQADVHALLEETTDQFLSLGKEIANQTLPVGAISTATGRPYLLCLAQGTAGVLPAVGTTEEVNRLEVQAATAALGGPVAVETSALYLAAGLLGFWHTIQAQFSELLLAAPTERDIRASRAMASGTSNLLGTLALDPGTGRMSFSETADDMHAATIDQCIAVHQAAQTCRVVAADNIVTLWGDQAVRHAAWLAPVAAAVKQQIPLYSDDIVLRATARANGVPAFGTLTLLDALITADRDIPTPDNTALRTLFSHHVVDLVQAADLLLNDPEGPLSAPALLNLGRPALWQRHPDNIVPLLLALITKIPQGDAQGLARFVSACATGWATAFTPASDVLATLAALVLAFNTGVTRSAARIVVPAIQGTGALSDAVTDLIPLLRAQLLEILTDRSGEFCMIERQAIEQIDIALQDFA